MPGSVGLSKWRTAACAAVLLCVARPSAAQITIELADYATAPITGKFNGAGNLAPLARINTLRPEPGPGGRLFLCDLNGPLYLLDAATRTFLPYLDFNGRDGKPGLFRRFAYAQGLANGLISFAFDPEYRRNGRFYTLHSEEPSIDASPAPASGVVPGLDVTGYATTPAVPIAGAFTRESVLVEWTDTDISNTVFEGSARELLRIRLNSQVHPAGDLVFNPTARPGDADWRVLYVAVGDGGAGEFPEPERRNNPQRLDTLVGKILRIVPDAAVREGTTPGANGRYRIPSDNPFVDVPGARGEVWALGLRNPHRLTWEADPADASRNRLLAMTIGIRTWEAVYVVTRGANYGYSEREGNELVRKEDNQTAALPADDRIPLRVSDTVTRGTVVPSYPVLQYNHASGFAIAGGFVYHGSRLPALRGRFVFGDLLSGRLWYADYDDMLKADDGNPATVAPMREITIRWKAPGAAEAAVYPTLRPVSVAGFEARRLAVPSAVGAKGPQRTDMRLALDADGEIYVMTKADGVIRAVVAAEPTGR